MSNTTVVVDYGIGNVLSVCRAIEACGGAAQLSADVNDIVNADRLVLPGVGAFGDCMAALSARSLIDPIKTFVATERPFLGICVGMQILLDYGEEFDGAEGLGLIAGRVRLIPPSRSGDGATRKIPHIGWTAVTPRAGQDVAAWSDTIFAGCAPATPLYFVHSFSAAPEQESHILAIADYDGFPVTAAVRRDNVTGTQFHPEKSGAAGLSLLRRYLRS